MTSRKSSAVLLVFLLALISLGLWWFLRPMAIAPKKAAATSTPAKMGAARIVEPPAHVELPKAPVIPAHAEATAVASENSDPQADLKTAIQDIVRLEDAHDSEAIYKNYTPPDILDPKQIQRMEELKTRTANSPPANPGVQQLMHDIFDMQARAYEVLEAQTPTYNATGDEATYQLTILPEGQMPGSQHPQTFIKINGKWYIKPPAKKGTINMGVMQNGKVVPLLDLNGQPIPISDNSSTN